MHVCVCACAPLQKKRNPMKLCANALQIPHMPDITILPEYLIEAEIQSSAMKQ